MRGNVLLDSTNTSVDSESAHVTRFELYHDMHWI